MRIAMIGTGYVGLVSGACFSEFGVEVTCVDKDAAKIERLSRGEMPIYEPGLDHLVASNMAAGRLRFTGDLKTAVAGADAVFIAVGTPSRRGDGHADLSYVFAAAAEIGEALQQNGNERTLVVTKSTVPVGTGRRVERILQKALPAGRFDVASNPEFLREGSAISDFMRPDRVVIGTESEHARTVLRALYRPLYLFETPIVFTTLETAELIKYAANAFLATKITFINEVADLCEAVGADVQTSHLHQRPARCVLARDPFRIDERERAGCDLRIEPQTFANVFDGLPFQAFVLLAAGYEDPKARGAAKQARLRRRARILELGALQGGGGPRVISLKVGRRSFQ